MIAEKQILELIETHFVGTDLFAVEVKVKPGNRIFVFIDSDTNVTIAQCVGLSRFIEKHFDREIEDFELNVSSSGLDQPYKLVRQYIKNIGREVAVVMKDKRRIEGRLLEADAEGINVLETVKVKKLVTETNHRLLYQEIAETKEIIKF